MEEQKVKILLAKSPSLQQSLELLQDQYEQEASVFNWHILQVFVLPEITQGHIGGAQMSVNVVAILGRDIFSDVLQQLQQIRKAFEKFGDGFNL
jgi:hypothetical protein